jgi:hypothetical protein
MSSHHAVTPASQIPVEGHGRWIFADGDSYDGEWNGGLMHGKGMYRFSTGDIYEGDFVKGLQHGVGTFISSSVKYVGQWSNGKRHGKGATICATGCVYEGEHSHGKLHGRASCQYAVDGRPDQLDLDYSWNSGDHFVGNVAHGFRDGPCTYTFFNGEKFACTWVKGRCPEFNARQQAVRSQLLDVHLAVGAASQRRDEVEHLVDVTRHVVIEHHALSAAKHNMILAVKDTMVVLAIAHCVLLCY